MVFPINDKMILTLIQLHILKFKQTLLLDVDLAKAPVPKRAVV
jgi:hypothetical protein